MTPEKQVQNKIVGFLKTLPDCFVERRNAGGFGYHAGVPDVWFVYRGRHVEVEVKAPSTGEATRSPTSKIGSAAILISDTGTHIRRSTAWSAAFLLPKIAGAYARTIRAGPPFLIFKYVKIVNSIFQ